MKICIISDVHGKWNTLKLPECDILISCGDYSFRGEQHMVRDFHKWLNKQEAGYIISVQGNHEMWVEQNFSLAKEIAEKECPGVFFIDEGLVEIEDLKIWCSAVTPWFFNWAWNRYPGNDIQRHWDKISLNTEILVTHGPPYGILDLVPDGRHAGCSQLLAKIKELKDLRLHAFGHLHMNNLGKEMIVDNVTFVNAAICNEKYEPIQPFYIINL